MGASVSKRSVPPKEEGKMHVMLGVMHEGVKGGDAAEAVLAVFDGNISTKDINRYAKEYEDGILTGDPSARVAAMIAAFNYAYPGCIYRVFLRFR